MNKCKKCNSEFIPSKGLLNFCSISCRNSRGQRSEQFKLHLSTLMKSRNIQPPSFTGDQHPLWVNRVKKQCLLCNVEFEETWPDWRETCSPEILQ